MRLQQTELGPRPAATPGCALPDESCTGAREKPLEWPGLFSKVNCFYPESSQTEISERLCAAYFVRGAQSWPFNTCSYLLEARGKTTRTPPVECLETRQANQSSQTRKSDDECLTLADRTIFQPP